MIFHTGNSHHRGGSAAALPCKPTLREQLAQIRARIGKHWRGELSLGTALTHCAILVLLPICSAFTLGLVAGVLTRFQGKAFEVIIHIGVGFTLAGVAWWCKGMFAMSNRLLSEQRMFAALVAFLIPVPVAWQLITSWSFDFAQSLDKDIVQAYRAKPTAEAWENNAIRVTALPELHRLYVHGDVGWGSAKALADAIRKNPTIKLIELESTGGFTLEANGMVELIEKNGMDTLARGRCHSACTEVFLAGRNRYVAPTARFGFHQSGYDGREHNTVWAAPEYMSSIYYREKGVSQAFSDKALNTSYYGIWRPDVLDVKRSGFATAWWSERPKQYD